MMLYFVVFFVVVVIVVVVIFFFVGVGEVVVDVVVVKLKWNDIINNI